MPKRSSRRRTRRAQPQQPPRRPPAIVVAEPGYIEAARRMLLEDSLIVIASELLDDPQAVAALRRLGLHERLCALLRWVFDARANPATATEGLVRDELRRTPIADRPEPFRSAGAVIPKADPVRE